MTHSSQEAAQDLVTALTEACTVCALQQQRADTARQNAETSHQQFLSLLTAQQSDATGAEAEQQRRQWWERAKGDLSAQTGQERFTEMSALSMRWEQALSDSQIALMRLYAFPEALESSERIADMLRSLRLLQTAEPPRTRPPLPSSPRVEGEAPSEGDRKAQKVAMALEFMRGMDRHLEEVRQSYQEKGNRTEALLKQAREEAEALAQRLRA
jgi:hypothetical protein